MIKSFGLVIALLMLAGALGAGCESQPETLGKACETGDDCISDFCVGGEAGTVLAPFCSDDCTGKKTGDACGDGQGKCIADFVSWCWLPCQTDAECIAVNPDRPRCSIITSSGTGSPFAVCIGKPTK